VVDGRTGYLVPVNDTKALAQALAALIESPEKRAAFGAAGRERCEEQFSWRRVGDLYHQLFLEVVSR
jgi:glycosyltransferase involved in cell wall biosynthesis